jgi:hypothetical protein
MNRSTSSVALLLGLLAFAVSLYDLEADSGERVNLVDRHPDIAEKLKKTATASSSGLEAGKKPMGDHALKERAGSPPRRKEKFDFDWKFSKGDFPTAAKIDFDDSQWQVLDVPHDWSILDTFSEDNPSGRPGGYASGGIGWYRKHFSLDDKDASSLVSIEFGGVYENSEVWINGHYLGKRPFGYISFNYDLTPHVIFDGSRNLKGK